MREKTIAAVTILFTILASCGDISDYSEELPGGHTYYSEGSCYKIILLNAGDHPHIESVVSDYKYNDDFITVSQVDTSECRQVGLANAKNKKFYIINVHKKLVLGPFDKKNFEIAFTQNRIKKDLYIE